MSAVAEHAMGAGAQRSGARDFVGCVELSPDLRRVAERRQRVARLAVGQLNGPACVCRRRAQQRSADLVSERGELVRRRAAARHVADGERDLHARAERFARRAGVLASSSARRIAPTAAACLALCNPEERQTRLWLAAMTTGVRERRFRVVELAAQAMQFGEVVKRGASGRRGSFTREDVARARDLGHRVGPLAAQLLDLGVSHETVAAIRDDLGLGVAPAAERLGPLARPRDVERFVARVECDAVDDSHVLRGQVVAGDGDHYFVEKSGPRGDFAAMNEGASLAESGQQDEVAGPEAASDRHGVGEVDVRLVEVSFQLVTDSREEHQVPVHRAFVAARVLERSRGATEPPVGVRRLAPHQPESEMGSGTRRALEVADACVCLVGATERGFARLVAPDQKRRAGEQLELGPVELSGLVGRREHGVRLTPGVAGEQIPRRGALRRRRGSGLGRQGHAIGCLRSKCNRPRPGGGVARVAGAL